MVKEESELDNLITIEDTKEESDRDKVLKILLNNENINLKTELNDKEIIEIAKLEIISKRIDSQNLKIFLETFKELRVSRNRQGRKEIIGAIQDDESKKQSGFFNQFVGDLMGRK